MELQTVKTSELVGAALDWAVAKCEGYKAKPSTYVQGHPFCYYTGGKYGGCESFWPSTHWEFGGPIIEREKLCIVPQFPSGWAATSDNAKYPIELGSTPLIAAMRCYVASKLGDCVDVPKELLVIA